MTIKLFKGTAFKGKTKCTKPAPVSVSKSTHHRFSMGVNFQDNQVTYIKNGAIYMADADDTTLREEYQRDIPEGRHVVEMFAGYTDSGYLLDNGDVIHSRLGPGRYVNRISEIEADGSTLRRASWSAHAGAVYHGMNGKLYGDETLTYVGDYPIGEAFSNSPTLISGIAQYASLIGIDTDGNMYARGSDNQWTTNSGFLDGQDITQLIPSIACQIGRDKDGNYHASGSYRQDFLNADIPSDALISTGYARYLAYDYNGSIRPLSPTNGLLSWTSSFIDEIYELTGVVDVATKNGAMFILTNDGKLRMYKSSGLVHTVDRVTIVKQDGTGVIEPPPINRLDTAGPDGNFCLLGINGLTMDSFTASSFYNNSYHPAGACDGYSIYGDKWNPDAGPKQQGYGVWYSNQDIPKWWQVDFGQVVQAINKMTIRNDLASAGHNRHPNNADIMISDDGIEFRTIKNITIQTDTGDKQIFTLPEFSARYIRISINSTGDPTKPNETLLVEVEFMQLVE